MTADCSYTKTILATSDGLKLSSVIPGNVGYNIEATKVGSEA
jgi:hypothetical protein